MSTTTTTAPNPGQAPVAQQLACGARRRPPLGTGTTATSHSDLRDRLLRCAG